MLSKNYISSLLGIVFLFALMLTGCAKDELIPPAGEDIFKSQQVQDVKGDAFHKSNVDSDSDYITDDEDDEDDSDRSSNR